MEATAICHARERSGKLFLTQIKRPRDPCTGLPQRFLAAFRRVADEAGTPNTSTRPAGTSEVTSPSLMMNERTLTPNPTKLEVDQARPSSVLLSSNAGVSHSWAEHTSLGFAAA
ncbi:MAG: hypothetical protein ABIP20_11200 [Chthoniobacteraceae bacterium]